MKAKGVYEDTLTFLDNVALIFYLIKSKCLINNLMWRLLGITNSIIYCMFNFDVKAIKAA